MTIPMDGVKKIPEMIGFAEAVEIEETIDWLKKTWMPE
jgi:hypothetical protein